MKITIEKEDLENLVRASANRVLNRKYHSTSTQINAFMECYCVKLNKFLELTNVLPNTNTRKLLESVLES